MKLIRESSETVKVEPTPAPDRWSNPPTHTSIAPSATTTNNTNNSPPKPLPPTPSSNTVPSYPTQQEQVIYFFKNLFLAF